MTWRRKKWRRNTLYILKQWKFWPRTLRYTLALLPSHGIGDAGLSEIADELGTNLEVLKKLIEAHPSFEEVLEHYWEWGQYPAAEIFGTPFRVGVHDISSLIAEESAVPALIALQRGLAKGKISSLAARALTDAGFIGDLAPKLEAEGAKETPIAQGDGLTIFNVDEDEEDDTFIDGSAEM